MRPALPDPPALQLLCYPFGSPAVLTLALDAGPLRGFWTFPGGQVARVRVGRA